MLFSSKAQGALEYLLIIGLAILVVAITIIALTGSFSSGKSTANTAFNDASTQVDTLRGLVPGSTVSINGHTYFKDNSIVSGLTGLWHFDEESGSVAVDSIGGNSGAVSNVTLNQTGKIGKAYSFNGSNSSVSLPKLDFPANTSFSVSIWINMDNCQNCTSSERCCVGRNASFSYKSTNDGKKGFVIRRGYDSDNIVDVLIGPGSASRVELKWTPTDPFGEWHQVVVVYDKTLNKAFIYGDGSKKQEAACSGFVPDSPSSESFVGNSINWGNFKGLIDEVAVWNRALTASEVSDLYNNTNK